MAGWSHPVFPSVVAFLVAAVQAQRVVNLAGRVLEQANREGVPGARVRIAGTSMETATDSAGRFRLSGEVSLRPAGDRPPGPPRFRQGSLWLESPSAGRVHIALFGIGGESLASVSLPVRAGMNRLDPFSDAPRNFTGFVRVRAERGTWLMRALLLSAPARHAWAGEAHPVREPLAKPAAGGQLEISVPGLVPAAVAFSADDQDLGDIVLAYPEPRTGVGVPPDYGATVLFDGSRGRARAAAELQSNWRDWPRFTPSEIRFRLARDPEFPGDTSRVTLQSCCNTLWGYDDIQATAGLYRDARIHVEWIGMGEYDVPFDTAAPNPNAADPYAQGQPGYINSGVYAASRYEIQIFSFDTSAAEIPGPHDMGSIVDDYPPAANRNRPNGVWQAYDIVFRGARFEGGAMVTPPYMSVWWNGTLVHDNRKLTGAAAGLANHSGEEHGDSAVYGLKLQSEGRDVRFRNVWIKKLTLEEPRTGLR